MPSASDTVRRYHDGTKHHFRQFARSLGYLDWASQPAPFRSFPGAQPFALFPDPAVDRSRYAPRAIAYGRLFDPSDRIASVSAEAIGDLLRHALGLSAWKEIGRRVTKGSEGDNAVGARWSLRANPSSGNLHPTEAYLVCGSIAGLAGSPAVHHYAADRHVLELRALLDPSAWAAAGGSDELLLVALTSIHWRESWKYGERAFRYCQHDLGHAIAALAASAAAIGWRARVLPAWPHRAIAALCGIDRDEDFTDAEREEPGCVLAIGPDPPGPSEHAADLFAAVAKAGTWSGRATQLSEDHVQWTFIDEIARATEDERPWLARAERVSARGQVGDGPSQRLSERGWGPASREKCRAGKAGGEIDARALFLQRRSAVAFDARSSTSRDAFLAMLAAVMPGDRPPWDALWWRPCVHLALFVHRVDQVAPGLYLMPRDPGALKTLRAAMNREFLWEPESDEVPLVCLAKGDCRGLAERLSCDQSIAADGFFSLGMVAEFDASLDEHGPSFYRQLFWETGVVGQILYLEAEAAGARATGIGCFYDDPVHDVLGLQGHRFQSLYHFSVGVPVEDARLTTRPGYAWESNHLVI